MGSDAARGLPHMSGQLILMRRREGSEGRKRVCNVCALGLTCEGCALTYKEREFRGGGA